jgi:P pilus assembly chaperone PapD
MPLYAYQKSGALSDIKWSTARQADGRWVVEAVNIGSGYVRIESADARQQTGLGFSGGLLGTVLPKSSRRWVLPQEAPVLDRTRLDGIARGALHDPLQTASKR